MSRIYLQLSALAKRAWPLLFIAIAGFYLWALGGLPLVGPDEPRYAQVAREMLARRDYLTPTLGGLPWFEKPALLYWLMMISFRILGVGEYAARLGPALCGLLIAVFVYVIGRAVKDERDPQDDPANTARWAALVWLSSLGAIGFSRGATFDIVLTMAITGSLACFFVAEVKRAGGSDRRWLLAGFYFFAALSLLAKGLVGFVIVFGVVAFYFVARREWPGRVLCWSLLWGLPLSIAIAGVWYGPMIARHGWTFIDQFIIQHHFARFVTNRYHHRGPFYFYLPVLIGLVLPWTIVLGAGLVSSRRWVWRGPSSIDRLRVLASVWLILPVIFFSFSESKLPAYILPALPAAAVLCGETISCFCRRARGEKVLRITGPLLLAVALAAIWYTHRTSELSLATAVLVGLPLIFAGTLAITRPQLRNHLFVLIALAALLTAALAVRFAAPVVAKRESVRDLLIAAADRGYSSTPVVQLHTVERTAEFYAAGRISYGSDGEPVKFEGVGQVVDAARRNNGVVLCFVPLELSAQLINARQVQTELVADNGRVALVVVRPN